MRPEINHDAHIRVGTCGSCSGPVVIYTGPWRSRERVCRYCGMAAGWSAEDQARMNRKVRTGSDD